jgi:hypothetical protein
MKILAIVLINSLNVTRKKNMQNELKVKKYEIVEYKDGFLCQVTLNNETYGDIYEARNHEMVFAWLRLVIGTYPGTMLNDEAA